MTSGPATATVAIAKLVFTIPEIIPIKLPRGWQQWDINVRDIGIWISHLCRDTVPLNEFPHIPYPDLQ